MEIGWIVYNYGIPIYPTLSVTRRESIDEYMSGTWDKSVTWRQLKRKGVVDCIKVEIRPLNKPTE